MRRLDIIGKRYGKLIVKEFSHIGDGNSYWKCLCDCGKFHVTSANRLRRGSVKSCGCLKFSKYELGESGLKILYSTYKSNAKKNNRQFNLTLEEFRNITLKECFYCGAKPGCISHNSTGSDRARDYTSYRYNGIDRIVPTKDYGLDNIVPCCKWCNYAKGNKSVEEFKGHILNIYYYMNKQKTEMDSHVLCTEILV